MRRTNIFLRIGVMLIIATLATSGIFIGSGTSARYVAEAELAAQARVARFAVYAGVTGNPAFANGGRFSQTGAAIVHLTPAGSPLNSITGGAAGSLWDTLGAAPGGGPAETDITVNDGTIIAPGTWGRIPLWFRNDSEVTVRFRLDTVDSTATGIPTANIQFSHNGTAWVDTLAAALTAANASPTLELPPVATLGGTGTPVGMNVYWRWRFMATGTPAQIQAQDVADTNLGVAAAEAGADFNARPGLTLTLNIRAEQVD